MSTMYEPPADAYRTTSLPPDRFRVTVKRGIDAAGLERWVESLENVVLFGPTPEDTFHPTDEASFELMTRSTAPRRTSQMNMVRLFQQSGLFEGEIVVLNKGLRKTSGTISGTVRSYASLMAHFISALFIASTDFARLTEPQSKVTLALGILSLLIGVAAWVTAGDTRSRSMQRLAAAVFYVEIPTLIQAFWFDNKPGRLLITLLFAPVLISITDGRSLLGGTPALGNRLLRIAPAGIIIGVAGLVTIDKNHGFHVFLAGAGIIALLTTQMLVNSIVTTFGNHTTPFLTPFIFLPIGAWLILALFIWQDPSLLRPSVLPLLHTS